MIRAVLFLVGWQVFVFGCQGVAPIESDSLRASKSLELEWRLPLSVGDRIQSQGKIQRQVVNQKLKRPLYIPQDFQFRYLVINRSFFEAPIENVLLRVFSRDVTEQDLIFSEEGNDLIIEGVDFRSFGVPENHKVGEIELSTSVSKLTIPLRKFSNSVEAKVLDRENLLEILLRDADFFRTIQFENKEYELKAGLRFQSKQKIDLRGSRKFALKVSDRLRHSEKRNAKKRERQYNGFRSFLNFPFFSKIIENKKFQWTTGGIEFKRILGIFLQIDSTDMPMPWYGEVLRKQESGVKLDRSRYLLAGTKQEQDHEYEKLCQSAKKWVSIHSESLEIDWNQNSHIHSYVPSAIGWKKSLLSYRTELEEKMILKLLR